MKTIYCKKTGEKVENYFDYLKTDWWKLFRTEFLRWSKKKNKRYCQICKKTSDFNIHHRIYKNLGNERKMDVVLLCQDCHNRVHKYIFKIKSKYPRRSLFAITNRILKSTRKNRRSGYNFYSH